VIIQDLTRIAHLYFCDFVSAKRLSCGQEARVLRGKSIGGTRNRIGDPALLPQNVAGLSGARPGAPTTQLPGPWEKNGLPAQPRK
jgi:hypothetical protein